MANKITRVALNLTSVAVYEAANALAGWTRENAQTKLPFTLSYAIGHNARVLADLTKAVQLDQAAVAKPYLKVDDQGQFIPGENGNLTVKDDQTAALSAIMAEFQNQEYPVTLCQMYLSDLAKIDGLELPPVLFAALGPILVDDISELVEAPAPEVTTALANVPTEAAPTAAATTTPTATTVPVETAPAATTTDAIPAAAPTETVAAAV